MMAFQFCRILINFSGGNLPLKNAYFTAPPILYRFSRPANFEVRINIISFSLHIFRDYICGMMAFQFCRILITFSGGNPPLKNAYFTAPPILYRFSRPANFEVRVNII